MIIRGQIIKKKTFAVHEELPSVDIILPFSDLSNFEELNLPGEEEWVPKTLGRLSLKAVPDRRRPPFPYLLQSFVFNASHVSR